MKFLPRRLPDWRVIGANPLRLAACLASIAAQFRHVDEHRQGGDGAEAWYAEQDVEAGLEAVLLGDESGLFAADRLDPHFDLLELLLALAFQQRQGQGFAPVEGSGAIFVKARRAACSSARLSMVGSLAGGMSGWRVAPKRASMAASTGSVLTRRPVVSAKRRACHGLISTPGKSALVSACCSAR
jgi:hypothetical protein